MGFPKRLSLTIQPSLLIHDFRCRIYWIIVRAAAAFNGSASQVKTCTAIANGVSIYLIPPSSINNYSRDKWDILLLNSLTYENNLESFRDLKTRLGIGRLSSSNFQIRELVLNIAEAQDPPDCTKHNLQVLDKFLNYH